MPKEFFAYTCPTCKVETNAALVAAALPDDVLIAETARRNGRRQTPHAGPGRPSVTRCPGCDDQMTTTELRDHRISCVRDRLLGLSKKGYLVWLSPKDPDPYPDFQIDGVDDEVARFNKLSTTQSPIPIELRKIAEIVPDGGSKLVRIRLLGRLSWDPRSTLWSFQPSQIGRPPGSLQ